MPKNVVAIALGNAIDFVLYRAVAPPESYSTSQNSECHCARSLHMLTLYISRLVLLILAYKLWAMAFSSDSESQSLMYLIVYHSVRPGIAITLGAGTLLHFE